MDSATAIMQLRWTRSDPPGLAGSDDVRRAIYRAALQQFEELLDAARAAGPASRPLPLFYAISQAGRAIVAAWGDDPVTHGHGLAQVPNEPRSTPLLHRRIKRHSRDKNDTFGAVARATQAGDIDGEVQLGALWTACPHAPRVPLEHWKEDWRLALLVVNEDVKIPSSVDLHEKSKALRVLPFADPMEATARHGEDFGSARYPTIPPEAGVIAGGREIGDVQTWEGYVVWRTDQTSIDAIAPSPTSGDSRYLIPLLPNQTKLLSPLLIWWALLFGLSIQARYHPELWTGALEVDHSTVAVGVERLLQAGLDEIPDLVYSALVGNFYPVPPLHRFTPAPQSA